MLLVLTPHIKQARYLHWDGVKKQSRLAVDGLPIGKEIKQRLKPSPNLI
jgi:hypothetical protein